MQNPLYHAMHSKRAIQYGHKSLTKKQQKTQFSKITG